MYPATHTRLNSAFSGRPRETPEQKAVADERDRRRERLHRLGRTVLDLCLFAGVMFALIRSVQLALA